MLELLPSSEWTLEHAAHLLNRAGFGGTPDQIRSLHGLGLPRAVATLLVGFGPQLPPPEWTREPVRPTFPGDGVEMTDAEKRLFAIEAKQLERERMQSLRAWWLERMREGRHPLLEKTTLFWHGHFATSFQKVRNATLMWWQNDLLRTHALGDFGALLRAIPRDPAMIRWLDLGRSRREAPNENFARELLELFTLGEGHYTEQDIKAAARAFTGHRLHPSRQDFLFARKPHDPAEKTFLDRTGKFGSDDIVGIVLAQQQCARFVSRRVWEYFAFSDPDEKTVEAAAQVFRDSGYQMRALLRTIFMSRAFYSEEALRTQIKGPVDWLANACIVLTAPVPPQPPLDFILSRLGQLPFSPPNVRGWEGGKSWISTTTLMLRYNVASGLLGNRSKALPRHVRARKPLRIDIGALAPAELRDQPDALAAALVFRLFGTPSLPKMRQRACEFLAGISLPASDADLLALCQKLTATPDFQLT